MRSLKGQADFLTRMQWIIMSAMILLVGGFYALVYRPQTMRLASLMGQITDTRRELIDAQTQTTMLPAVEADVEQLKLRLQKFKTLPKRDPQDQVRREMAQIMQQSSVKNPFMGAGATNFGDNKINTIPFNLKLEGDFNSIFAVLRQTEKLQLLTRVPKLNVKAIDNLGQVKADLTMNVYYMAD